MQLYMTGRLKSICKFEEKQVADTLVKKRASVTENIKVLQIQRLPQRYLQHWISEMCRYMRCQRLSSKALLFNSYPIFFSGTLIQLNELNSKKIHSNNRNSPTTYWGECEWKYLYALKNDKSKWMKYIWIKKAVCKFHKNSHFFVVNRINTWRQIWECVSVQKKWKKKCMKKRNKSIKIKGILNKNSMKKW